MYGQVRIKCMLQEKRENMTKKWQAIEKYHKNKKIRNVYQEAKKSKQPHNLAIQYIRKEDWDLR